MALALIAGRYAALNKPTVQAGAHSVQVLIVVFTPVSGAAVAAAPLAEASGSQQYPVSACRALGSKAPGHVSICANGARKILPALWAAKCTSMLGSFLSICAICLTTNRVPPFARSEESRAFSRISSQMQ